MHIPLPIPVIHLEELLLEHLLSFRDRLSLHQTCCALGDLVADATHWRSLKLHDSQSGRSEFQIVRLALDWMPEGAIESLLVHIRRGPVSLSLPPGRCSLVELDISQTIIIGTVELRAAFVTCGPTLRRLNMSGVHIYGHKSVSEVVMGSAPPRATAPVVADLFAPLVGLEVLLAHDTDPMLVNKLPDGPPADDSMIR